MDVYWIPITLFVLCLPVLQCLSAPLDEAANEEAKRPFGSNEAGFSAPGDQGGFQTWTDWLNKRSFGEFPFVDKNLQAWKEWMDKRGHLNPAGGPNFGGSYGKSFQQWKDWMNKRSFPGNGHAAFKGTPPSKSQFQSWNDWMVKRGLGGNAGAALFGQPSGGAFQSWGDYSKRADRDLLLDYYKRNFGMANSNNRFNLPFNSNPNLMKWDDGMFKRSSGDKRQLGDSATGFGQYKQHFTNGLQDWRNTFKNVKRTSSSNAKSSKHESN